MTKHSIGKNLLALFFLVLIVWFPLSGAPGAISSGLLSDGSASVLERLRDFRDDVLSSMRPSRDLIELNGILAKAMDMRSCYSREYGFYLSDDMVALSAYRPANIDYDVEQTVDFYRFLDSHGIRMLYVNLPNKYLDDAVMEQAFAVRSYCNSNMDRLVGRLRAADVPVLDLRERIREEGLDVSEFFYRTDHHWTVPAGLWATRHIAGSMNESCGYDIDLSLYDEENFCFRHMENCWVGEQGRKLSQSYIGLDDYTEIKPNFETHYGFSYDGEPSEEGCFDDLIDEGRFENAPGTGLSWHYAYQMPSCINYDVPKGKILLLGDSFAHVLTPFLSLSIHEIDPMILRYYSHSLDLRQHILDGGYDTVLICYSSSMLGEHSNPDSANYRMFDFH